jgi:hypothetical protein
MHELKVGSPSKSPFVPGGRRFLIRALGTLFSELVPENRFINQNFDRPLEGFAALAIANLVFKEQGVQTAAELLVWDLRGGEGQWRLDATSSKLYEDLIVAIRDGNVAEMIRLLSPKVQKPGAQ